MWRHSRVSPVVPQPVPETLDKAHLAPEINVKTVMEERSIDESRRLRVVIIGAGISGILACIRFKQRIPNIDLCLYDKNAEIGGTWFENRYPGCACDIPAHTYQATFEPNKEWSSFYAEAPEILQYWKHVAEKYGCMKYINLGQRVTTAIWDEDRSSWHLKIENLDTSHTYTDECDVLIQATGALNNWKWPKIPGLHDFKGKLIHSASWDKEYDYKGKRVAVIGNGSSGIQIVPALLPDVVNIDHYIRSRTWISPTFAREQVEKHGQGRDNFAFSAEEIQNFKTNHASYQKFRKEVELELQSVHGVTITGDPIQLGAHDAFAENMKQRLADKPGLIDKILPSFPPGCRRLTPGPGYLEALTSEKVDLITSSIVKVDDTGIITSDGQHRPVDCIVCATGFDTSCAPRFLIKGRGGVTLSERWKKAPETYISIATDGFPNYFMSLGPNAGLGDGNLLVLIESALDYFTKCVRKMQRDNIRAMSVKREAVRRFTEYCDQYFARTVFSGKCRSWYKGGTENGRITALWPGSSLHAMNAFANPRWEDFEYEYVNDNASGWLGNGWTENERLNTIAVDYLDDDKVDFPQVVDTA
ncbi:uncharacterized protein N7515_002106 [Penicillium bovifimosum]|uniref:L-ornithine N(5)-monooxygenase n=1 Tax=Penicillium bovifimosum TaxID=126998 RepID=A0A9W9HB03_9EURO|nr:uncharacterized protein N7515_002106 [Penicillium bovifimosum]KAJ5143319.1 hypothetical protein N7515_002106 [Penicillium bovifimosum]